MYSGPTLEEIGKKFAIPIIRCEKISILVCSKNKLWKPWWLRTLKWFIRCDVSLIKYWRFTTSELVCRAIGDQSSSCCLTVFSVTYSSKLHWGRSKPLCFSLSLPSTSAVNWQRHDATCFKICIQCFFLFSLLTFCWGADEFLCPWFLVFLKSRILLKNFFLLQIQFALGCYISWEKARPKISSRKFLYLFILVEKELLSTTHYLFSPLFYFIYEKKILVFYLCKRIQVLPLCFVANLKKMTEKRQTLPAALKRNHFPS